MTKMEKGKDEKPIQKCMGSTLSNNLLQNCGHPPWLFTKAEMTATLIPRHITHHIVAYPAFFQSDMLIASQRRRQAQQPSASHVVYHGTRANETDLHKAACSGSIAGVREVVHKSKDLLGHANAQGNLPLHLAIEKGYKDVALYLFEKYPQGSYALNQAKISPLYLAVVGPYKDLVESMLKAVVKADATQLVHGLMQGKSILHAAITSKNKEMVRTILKYQPDLIKSKDEEGRTPLSYAAYKGIVDIAGYLLTKFPNSASTPDNDKSFAVHKACLGGHVEILKIFHSTSPESLLKKDNNGRTVLHLAAKEHGNRLKGVVSYLLSLNDISKVLINGKDENRRNPLALAELSRNFEVVQLITKAIHP